MDHLVSISKTKTCQRPTEASLFVSAVSTASCWRHVLPRHRDFWRRLLPCSLRQNCAGKPGSKHEIRLVLYDTLQHRLLPAVKWQPTAYHAEDRRRRRRLQKLAGIAFNRKWNNVGETASAAAAGNRFHSGLVRATNDPWSCAVTAPMARNLKWWFAFVRPSAATIPSSSADTAVLLWVMLYIRLSLLSLRLASKFFHPRVESRRHQSTNSGRSSNGFESANAP